jgi:hypothetical protein
MDLEERKVWLEGKVGRPVPDPVWRELKEGNYVQAGDMESYDEDLLVDRTRSYLRVRRRNLPDFGMSPRRFSPDHDIPSCMCRPEDVRREVFAECVANVADELPEVWAFRDEVLGDSHPLTYEQALHYVDEDGQVREDAPHAGRLKNLSEGLANTFVWRAEDAALFVLCNYYTPPVRIFSVEGNVTRHQGGPEVGSITITVEPWLPAETVIDIYKKVQKKMLGKRPHRVSRKRLRVLELVEMMGEGASWRECMEQWNELHPEEEKYKDVRNFSKAYKEVREYVLEPGYTALEPDERAAREERRDYIRLRFRDVERYLKEMRKVERALRIVREATGEHP